MTQTNDTTNVTNTDTGRELKTLEDVFNDPDFELLTEGL